MRPAKSIEHKEIFEIEEGKKRWIENWETFLYLGYKSVETDVDIIPFEKLKAYPVGETKAVKEGILEGHPPDELFYPDEPTVEIRKISILGTCLPGCEGMMKDLGFTHAYGNRYGWPDYDEVERLGMKVFVNVRGDTGELTEEKIKNVIVGYENQNGKWVPGWKDRPGCGGYWCDQLGHEPDITNPPMERREWFYETVRKYDPDKQNHAVMEMMDMTEADDFPDDRYLGWKNAFSDKTHDLLLFDAYPDMHQTDAKIRQDLTNVWNRFIKVYPHVHQVIPQMIACKYRKGAIWTQYNFWNEIMSSSEFDNPYRGEIGVCWYKDECVRKDEAMQEEIRAINAGLGVV